MNQKQIGYSIVAAGFIVAVTVELIVFVNRFGGQSVPISNENDTLCECKNLSPSHKTDNETLVDDIDLHWVAALYFKISVVDKTLGCSSNILSPSWQITAAHCFKYPPTYDISKMMNDIQPSIWSAAGHPKHNVTAAVLTPEYNREVDQTKIYLHPDYSHFFHQLINMTNLSDQKFWDEQEFEYRHLAENDIAIFKTVSPFELKDTILPACLYIDHMNQFDDLIVPGHGMARLSKYFAEEDDEIVKLKDGHTIMKNPISNRLYATKLYQLYPTTVEGMLSPNISLNESTIYNIIWAKSKSESVKEHGDSGSGLLSLIGDRLFMVGILSGKDFIPGISNYARVNRALDWINAAVDEDQCFVHATHSYFTFDFTRFMIVLIFAALILVLTLFLVNRSKTLKNSKNSKNSK